MKRLVLTGIATFAFALGAFAQGSIILDNSSGNFGFTANGAGSANWYSGTLGLEVWELNAATIPSGVNVAPAPGSGLNAYSAMKAAGFKLEKTLPGLHTSFPASVSFGEVDMPDVSPAGSSVVVGLAAWNTSAASWSAMLNSADANTRAGVIAFVNATANYTQSPAPPPPGITGWDTSAAADLVMMPVPEPSTLALAGLGAAALLIFRRRK